MMNIRLPTLVVVLASASPGCGEAPPPPPREFPPTDVLQRAPVFMPARLQEIRGSRETSESIFLSPVPIDSVARWYRSRFDALGWEIVGDFTAADGTVTLHIEREGPPLWVIIRMPPDQSGTEFSVIGAAPDTTASPES
jgi:hypothetical protein